MSMQEHKWGVSDMFFVTLISLLLFIYLDKVIHGLSVLKNGVLKKRKTTEIGV